MKKSALVLLLAAPLVLWGGSSVKAAELADQIVAMVGNQPIMRSDIFLASRELEMTPQQFETELRNLIELRLIAQAARSEGIRDPRVVVSQHLMVPSMAELMQHHVRLSLRVRCRR